MKNLNRLNANLTEIAPERILQFGGGNFLRGFVDWIFDDLNKNDIFNGSAVVVKPTQGGNYDDLDRQNGLFHVVLDGIAQGERISRIDLVQSVSRSINPYTDWEDFLETARQPGMRYIVSNTTEAGIAVSEADRFEDTPPKEFPAKLTRWLYERYIYFSGSALRGCIILPCELIEDNGKALQNAVLEYIELWDLGAKFRDWIQNHNYFYDTLVDRIVSGYPHDRAAGVLARTGYKDALLVAGEYYHSWIIAGHPQIQKEIPFSDTGLNIRYVDDLSRFRVLKVRILNGAHTALVPVGYLSGYRTVGECMKDKRIHAFLQQLLKEEVRSTIQDIPLGEVDQFIEDVLDRFKNPVLAHQLLDISLNSFSKFITRLLPTLEDYIQTHKKIPGRILFSLTCLILFYRGEYQDEEIPLRDDAKNIAFARETWLACEDGKISMVTLVSQFLSKLGIDHSFPSYREIRTKVEENIENILEEGVPENLEWLNGLKE